MCAAERVVKSMLKEFDEAVKKKKKDSLPEVVQPDAKALREKLSSLQIQLKNHKLPVIVLLEGWGAAGKGGLIGRTIRELDPRFYTVATKGSSAEEEKRKPFLWKYFNKIPEEGKLTFFDTGWMQETVRAVEREELNKKALKARIVSINTFERQLTDNGYLLLKVFLHVSKKEQRKRLDKLEDDKNTAWRVSIHDRWQNLHYDDCLKDFDRCMEATSTDWAPWHIIDGNNRGDAACELTSLLVSAIENALRNGIPQAQAEPREFPLLKTKPLRKIDPNKSIEETEYEIKLKSLQNRLGELHNKLYRKKVPVVLAYEGWDAAGKGGNIRRITGALDPRGFEVHPIASPEPHEKARHYLWRFWTRLPKDGHIAIFDRTWYGRVLVERIEGFCTETEWKRAYTEINEFEKELSDWGAVILKFWVHIDKDTQLKRFEERQNTPSKQWKITDEDWRNREKWPAYEEAVDEMLQKTSTEYAPWYVIESNDKKYARIKTLQLLVDALEKALK